MSYENEADLKRLITDWLQIQQNQGRLMWLRLNSGTFVADAGTPKHRVIRGCPKGTADLLILCWPNPYHYTCPHETIFVELKVKGKQSEAQREFQKSVEAQGARYELVRSLEDLERILKGDR